MPSSRITQRFESCKAAGRTAFVAFVTAGYPNKKDTVDALLGLEESGADVIELGVPFSDPLADGATIEEASRLALEHSTSLADCFSFVEAARSKGLKVPLVLMGYYNNFLQHGLDKTCEDAKAKGVDGFIIVDLPCEQADDFHPKCVQHELSLVPIVAPTSTPERMQKAAAVADSFIYVVSVLGVTGARAQVSSGVKEVVQGVRKATEGRGVFVAVGFGVSSREHVQEIGTYSDGCVVGSKIVQALGGSGGLASVKTLVKELSGGPLAAPATNGNHPAKRQRTGDVKATKENSKWYFGSFGGRYIPETLMQAHEELSIAWDATKKDPVFQAELKRLRTEFVGGPTPIYHAKNLTEKLGGAQLWFKREELAHTGAHKINNSLGQALLAKRLGKPRIIAETGAGQHGVATATACALLGLECIVYMGSIDMERQALNVFRMKMLGAKVVPAESGSKTLKDAINEAMRDWVTNITTTHYIIGSAVGPHPFPDIVRDLQSVIGTEARAQMLNDTSAHPTFTSGPGRLPDTVVACVGGGSNAIGMFAPFLEDKVEMHGVEAGGTVEAPKPDGSAEKAHSATLSAGTPGVLHGSNTYLLQTSEGQITETHSISAGLDYPGVGPQHAFLKDSGRVKYVSVTDSQALQAMQDVSRNEGIIPALEPSHALYYSMELCKTRPKDHIVLVNLCGRGDKDMLSVAKALGVQLKD